MSVTTSAATRLSLVVVNSASVYVRARPDSTLPLCAMTSAARRGKIGGRYRAHQAEDHNNEMRYANNEARGHNCLLARQHVGRKGRQQQQDAKVV